jgi:hypothetical protein
VNVGRTEACRPEWSGPASLDVGSRSFGIGQWSFFQQVFELNVKLLAVRQMIAAAMA